MSNDARLNFYENLGHPYPYQGPPHQAARHIEGLFRTYEGKLGKVAALAQQVKMGIQRIDPFIQQHTSMVCPRCQAVCCLNKHAYYKDYDEFDNALRKLAELWMEMIDEFKRVTGHT